VSWDCKVDNSDVVDLSSNLLPCIGVLTSASLEHAAVPCFATGNYSSFALIVSTGGTVHNDAVYNTKRYGVPVQSGDTVRTEIDHTKRTVSWTINGKSYGVAYTAGDSIHGKDKYCRHDTDTVVWPSDNLFYPAISLGQGLQVTANGF
jgi:hypothetical protein